MVVLAALSRHWALSPGPWLLRSHLPLDAAPAPPPLTTYPPPHPPTPAGFHHGKFSREGEEGRKVQQLLTAKEHWGIWEWTQIQSF